MARNSNANQRRYNTRQQEQRGLIRVMVWVPVEARDTVIALADRLRKKAKQLNTRGG